MSSSDPTGRANAPLAETSTNGFLVDEDYAQDLLRALEQVGASPGPPQREGRHGLQRISLAGAPDVGLPGRLYQHLQNTNPAVLGHYGRDRHYAIGALSSGVGDPQIWGSGEIGEGGWTIEPSVVAPVRRDEDAGLGVVIGMLDTKINSHEYLNGGYIALPKSMYTGAPKQPATGETGHATFVAGLILQQAPAATVHVRQVLGDDGICDTLTLHDAILDLAEQPIDILNLSLGCSTADDRAPFAIQRALEQFRAARPQAVVVAAAGNHPDGHRFWPAALPEVLAVTVAGESADGSWDEDQGYPLGEWVNAAAPGRQVISTFLTGSYRSPAGRSGEEKEYEGWAFGNGTSFACAIATGYLARIRALDGKLGNVLTAVRDAGGPATGSGQRPVLGTDYYLH